MANTTNLNLPLIDNTMTADVPRDMNALAQAVDSAVVVAIEDARVTLIDSANSTSITAAPTANALKTVNDSVTAQLADIVNPPRAQYTSTVDKVCPTFQWVVPSWNVKVYDTNNFVNQVDPTTIVINKSGTYLIQAQVTFAASATAGQRNIRITKNNDAGTIAYNTGLAASNATRINASGTAFLNAGETVRVLAYQDTGGDLSLSAAAGTILSITMLCPA
jgi:hypothetical protein